MLFLVSEYNWPTVLDTNMKYVVVRVQMCTNNVEM